MLAVDFDAIADALNNNATPIANFVQAQAESLDNNFDYAAAGISLPIVDQTIGDLVSLAGNSWSQPITAAVQSIRSAMQNLSPGATESQIRNAVFNAIAPTGLLQQYHHSQEDFGLESGANGIRMPGVSSNQIQVDLSGDDLEISLTLGLLSPDLLESTDVDFGLPSLPFFELASADVDLHLGAYLKHLTFGIKNDEAFVGFDQSINDDITIFAHASFAEHENVLAGQLGFLSLSAIDEKGGNGIGSSLNLGFQFDAVGGDGFGRNGPIQMIGDADVDLDLTLAFVDENDDFPSLTAGFHLDWGFDQALSETNKIDSLSEFGQSPQVEFTDVSLDVGSYINEVIAPIVNLLQTVTAPLQPLVDVITTPIPLISDLGDWLDLGDRGDFSIDGLLETIDNANLLPPQYDVVVGLVGTIVDVLEFVNLVQADMDGKNAMINFGDFSVSGENGDLDLRTVAAAAVGGGNWSALQANATNAANKIVGNLPSSARKLLGIGKFPVSDFDFGFPILEDPETGAFQLLLGRDVDLIRFDLLLESVDIPLGPAIGFDILGLVEAEFDPGTVTLDFDFGVGYDTYGLRRLAQQSINGQTLDPSVLAEGFYVENQHSFDNNGEYVDINEFQIGLSGGVQVLANLGLFSVGGGGSLTADLGLGIYDDGTGFDNDPFKVRGPELEACAFTLSGGLAAYANVLVRIGADFGFGFIGVEIDEQFGGTIVDFDIGGGCNDNSSPIASVSGSTLTLLADSGDVDEKFFVDKVVTLVDHDNNPATDPVNREAFRVTRSVKDASGNPLSPRAMDFVIAEPGDSNSQFYGPITRIVAAGNGGNDEIHIKSSVGDVDAEIYGGLPIVGDTNSVNDSDKLIYGGSGEVLMYGGGGNDQLFGGSGVNYLYGESFNDLLQGGDGTNHLYGGADNDEIRGAGVETNAFGESGNDRVHAGSSLVANLYGDFAFATITDGNDVIWTNSNDVFAFGGNGSDDFHWRYGQGASQIYGGPSFDEGGFGNDRLFMIATNSKDDIDIRRSTSVFEIEVATSPDDHTPTVTFITGIEELQVEGIGAADTIDVWDLYGTSINKVAINLADDAATENVGDVTTIHGADATIGEDDFGRWDKVEIRSDYVAVHPDGIEGNIGGEIPIWSREDRNLIDGISRITLSDQRLINTDFEFQEQTVDSYQVQVSNQTPDEHHPTQVEDVLNIELHDGAAGINPTTLEVFGETATISSIPGLTNVNMGDGVDFLLINLTEQQESGLTSSGFTIDPGGYFGKLNIDAGAGDATILFDADISHLSGGAQGAVNMTLTDDQLFADSDGWEVESPDGSNRIGLPISTVPIDFIATGGKYTQVAVRGSDGQRPIEQLPPEKAILAVQSTLATALTTIVASNHDAIVSSDANYDLPPIGDLSQIGGNLKILAEPKTGLTESVAIYISDHGAADGNRAATILDVTPDFSGNPIYNNFQDTNVILGFAGVNDETVIGWRQNPSNQSASTLANVTIVGSNDPLLRERFTYAAALDYDLNIEANDGPDRVDVFQNSLAELTIATGKGHDYVSVAYGLENNLYRSKPIEVLGESNSWDRLRVDDSLAISPALYVLDADSLATAPTSASPSDNVSFSAINDIQLETTQAGASVLIGNRSFPTFGMPRSRINLPGAIDFVGGGLQSNTWEVIGADEVLLNHNVLLSGSEILIGGDSADTFVMREGGSISGYIAGSANVDGSVDTISYAPRNTAATVDLTNLTATDVGLIINVDKFVGGNAADVLVGGSLLDSVWHLTGQDRGHILYPFDATLRTDFESFETLVSGTANDVFNFYDQSMLTGGIQLTTNSASSLDGFDFNSTNLDIVVELVEGTIEYADSNGDRTTIAVSDSAPGFVIGGQGDDIIIGNNNDNVLFGNAGNDLLVGSGGDDFLSGDSGQDVLIGGMGADIVGGGLGSDLLIGGYAIYDSSIPDLLAIRDVWRRSDLSYTQRIAELRIGDSALIVETTVYSDIDVDELYGESELDWFWGGLNDIADIDFANEIFL